jgi:uncharacterized protein (TIGR02145 family)
MNSVKIGNQIWLKENLKIDRFRNGDQIPEAKNRFEWMKATEEKKPVWSHYDYNAKYESIFGKIYNGFAVTDLRHLAPEGYHIPSDSEWDILAIFLGGKQIAASSLRIDIADCIKLGLPIEWAGTNSSGFSALPGSFFCSNGCLFDHGQIFEEAINIDTSFWSSSWRMLNDGRLSTNTPIIGTGSHFGGNVCDDLSGGRYIRCVKNI